MLVLNRRFSLECVTLPVHLQWSTLHYNLWTWYNYYNPLSLSNRVCLRLHSLCFSFSSLSFFFIAHLFHSVFATLKWFPTKRVASCLPLLSCILLMYVGERWCRDVGRSGSATSFQWVDPSRARTVSPTALVTMPVCVGWFTTPWWNTVCTLPGSRNCESLSLPPHSCTPLPFPFPNFTFDSWCVVRTIYAIASFLSLALPPPLP